MSADTAFEIGRLYAPLKNISDVLTASQSDLFIRLPGLIGYWPMSITDTAGLAINHSQGGADLGQTGSCPIGYDGNAFRHLGNGTNYLSAAGYGLTGAETWITSSLQGITVGAWVMVDNLGSIAGGVISKDAPAPQRGYALTARATADFVFAVSNTGGSSVAAVGAITYSIGVWRFVVGRFIPSVEIAIIIDGDKTTNTTAIPAVCNVSTQAFEIGRYFSDNARVLNGKVRDVFICQTALSDAFIEEIRQSSTP